MTSVELAVTPWELLEHYDVDSTMFFASPQRTILAQCRYVDLITQSQAAGLLNNVETAFARAQAMGEHNPLVIGAVPFDNQAAAYLTLPSDVAITQALPALAEVPALPRLATEVIEAVPAPEQYAQSVERLLGMFAEQAVNKVVLSRSLHLHAAEALNVQAIIAHLAQRNPLGYTFALPLPTRRTLVGASPELLVARRGGHVIAHPLAGSVPRSADPLEDARRAATLLESAKDLHEHAFVVDAVAETLAPYCRKLSVPAPALVSTPTMWHLATRITGSLHNNAPSALEMALNLHPTPAVCGTPTTAARQIIQTLEPFERGFFAGLVGWCDAQGDGEWAVTIRCAEIIDRSVHLFAGAGIVPGSDPQAEVAETAAKLRTMLSALGLESEAGL